MSEPRSEAADGASSNHVLYNPATGERRYLSSQPEHFFSNKFDLSIDEDDDVVRPDASPPTVQLPFIQKLTQLLLHDQTILLILVVGVPLLAYCILSSP